jgi:DNA-binding NtrC family response regulator
MRRVSELIGKAAPTPSTVLIEGESGTGKELVARAIHRNSPRAEAPFIAINCAVLPSELVESELFGHEKGAFTGAVSRKKGRFETADRGTLFLDEIGELPLQLQAKLLRAVQSGSFDRVGGLEPVEVDVRILAATNRNLREAVAEGQFREDLYFRLNVIAIRMPALRERPEDIPALAAHFASTVGAKLGRRLTISEPALDVLKRYDWPGNVRELENAIERAAVLGNGDVILPEDLPEPVLEAQAPGSEGDATNYQDAVNAFKRRHILDVIQKTRDMSEAAGLLGVHPNNLNRLIRRLNLRQELAARSGGRTG